MQHVPVLTLQFLPQGWVPCYGRGNGWVSEMAGLKNMRILMSYTGEQLSGICKKDDI
jgi:hypothetical protein